MSDSTSRPANDAYRDGWERCFGRDRQKTWCGLPWTERPPEFDQLDREFREHLRRLADEILRRES